ncbi:MAG: hypothetical protein K0R47_421 [Brevibacillus sp.]|nr:hypothetical protein [Brevibacillus sp.]
MQLICILPFLVPFCLLTKVDGVSHFTSGNACCMNAKPPVFLSDEWKTGVGILFMVPIIFARIQDVCSDSLWCEVLSSYLCMLHRLFPVSIYRKLPSIRFQPAKVLAGYSGMYAPSRGNLVYFDYKTVRTRNTLQNVNNLREEVFPAIRSNKKKLPAS